MSNIDQSGIEDEHQKGSASFRNRNKELYTRDNPINKQLPIDSFQQNVAQKLPVPSQVVENLSHSSGSSLSLEGMEFTLRTKKRQTIEQSNSGYTVEDTKFVKSKARELFHQFKFLSNQDLLYDSKLCDNFFDITRIPKSPMNWADNVDIVEQQIRRKRNSASQYVKEYFIRKYLQSLFANCKLFSKHL